MRSQYFPKKKKKKKIDPQRIKPLSISQNSKYSLQLKKECILTKEPTNRRKCN